MLFRAQCMRQRQYRGFREWSAGPTIQPERAWQSRTSFPTASPVSPRHSSSLLEAGLGSGRESRLPGNYQLVDGLILWNSLWGEFISIPKEVIGMATTCEDKSRAVPKVIRSGV